MNLDKMNKAQLVELVSQLQAEDQNQEVSKLQARIAELEAQLAEAGSASNDDVEGYKKMVDELAAENRALKATKGNGKPMVVISGKHYQVLGSITANGGKVYTPEQIAADIEFAAAQVKRGNKMLREIPTEA